MVYYLLGVLVGFAKTGNYYTINSIFDIILPIVFYIVISELLRYQLLVKSSESKLLICLVCIFFVVIDTTISFSIHSNDFDKEMFLLLALTVLPSITKNILCTFLSLEFGYKASIFYALIMGLYSYLMLIVPNPNEYVYSLIFLLFPLYVLWRVKKWLAKDKVSDVVNEEFKNKKVSLLYYLPLVLVTVFLVYFISGYFRYYAVAIASGSMEPVISKGDVVVVDKEFTDLKVGDILAYNYENKVVVHRVYRIINTDDVYYIYTKGDANNNFDNYKIDKSMFVGVVKFRIPVIGYPTVLLNELW